MKRPHEPIPDWVFALFIAFLTTLLMGGVLLAGFKILMMIGWGR